MSDLPLVTFFFLKTLAISNLSQVWSEKVTVLVFALVTGGRGSLSFLLVTGLHESLLHFFLLL